MNRWFLCAVFFLKTFQVQGEESDIDVNDRSYVPRHIVDYRPHFENMMYNPANLILRIIFSSKYVDDFARLECVSLLMEAKANVLAIHIARMFKDYKLVRGRLKTMTYVIPEPDDPEVLEVLEKRKKEQMGKLSKAKEFLKTQGKRPLGLGMLNKIAGDPVALRNIKKEARRLIENVQKKRAGLCEK